MKPAALQPPKDEAFELRVEVGPEDIEQGKPGRRRECPAGLAVRRSLRSLNLEQDRIRLQLDTVDLEEIICEYQAEGGVVGELAFTNTPELRRFIELADDQEIRPAPVSFTMRIEERAGDPSLWKGTAAPVPA